MDKSNVKKLRTAISGYTRPSTSTGLLIFVVDILVYAAAITGVIFLENIYLRIICSVLAGLQISLLFVVAHDAAHDSFTGNKRLNRFIARASFLPCFHNYSLWLIAHNRLHHQQTNLKGHNSWSPLSRDEFIAMPAWRQWVEKLYRCPAGICVNYLVERWWKNKFFPYKRITGDKRKTALLDFALVAAWMIMFLSILVYAGSKFPHTSPVELVVLGFIVPVLYASFMIGVSVYMQHTHETIPWFRTEDEARKKTRQEEVTMHVRFPLWYNLLSHNVMEHTAHHVDPRVPLYNLAKAQRVLTEILGDKMVSVTFSLPDFIHTMSRCKLYDYENHCWLDFEGRVTSQATLSDTHIEYQHAA